METQGAGETKRVQHFHESVWIGPGAQIYGEVAIAEGASIWPHAVIRAECNAVAIGRMTNIQDFVMIHVGFDHGVQIGEFCSITHHATVHGATIEDHCLIGINATLKSQRGISVHSIGTRATCDDFLRKECGL